MGRRHDAIHALASWNRRVWCVSELSWCKFTQVGKSILTIEDKILKFLAMTAVSTDQQHREPSVRWRLTISNLMFCQIAFLFAPRRWVNKLNWCIILPLHSRQSRDRMGHSTQFVRSTMSTGRLVESDPLPWNFEEAEYLPNCYTIPCTSYSKPVQA